MVLHTLQLHGVRVVIIRCSLMSVQYYCVMDMAVQRMMAILSP